ncbi:MAG: 50S ribosomal protein L13 [Patescibacteria group bacterium]
MKTYQPKQSEVKRNWHLIDAKGAVLGRLATQVATYLIGKHKAEYSTHMDSGDYVVVINAKEVKVTGNKEKAKTYYSHSGYPGGFKEVKLSKLRLDRPARIIQLAVKRMMATNRLRDKRMARLKVFSGETNQFKDKFTK